MTQEELDSEITAVVIHKPLNYVAVTTNLWSRIQQSFSKAAPDHAILLLQNRIRNMTMAQCCSKKVIDVDWVAPESEYSTWMFTSSLN